MFTMDFPNAVTTFEAFFGRRLEFQKAIDVLRSENRVPVLIIGERRIGKTSLHNVVIASLQQLSPSLIPLMIEPREKKTVDLFAEAILRQCTMHLKRDIRETGLVNEAGQFHLDSPDRFGDALFRILPPDWDRYFLLCIDEFDEILRLISDSPKEERQRFDVLMHTLVEGSSLPVKLFFTTTRIPDQAKEHYPEALLRRAEVIELQPFSNSISAEMIDRILEGSHLELTPEAKESLIDFAGGHPYFLKLLLANMASWAENSGRYKINQITFETEVMPQALDDARPKSVLKNMWKAHFTENEKRVLLFLAVREEPVAIDEFMRAGYEIYQAAENLIHRHYLAVNNDRCAPQIRYIDDWLRNWDLFEDELDRLNVHQSIGIGMND